MTYIHTYTCGYHVFLMVHDRRQARLSDVIIIITRTCPGTVAASVQTKASECRRLRYMCAVATDLD
ncbi:Uncharacterized protein FWK35_00003877 [Aphis craccivora]|uniref:Uncharacterized protein n=1 Tax=Aphis craccivora TaxID=307492 RepID=A0A6G0ZN93_APHCR|nr:Uncharacterized protein FWK35_00003877 [Aphis craccivora]